MAVITVTTNADVVAVDGATSLREALSLAGSGDTITFGASMLGQSIRLNSTLTVAAGTNFIIQGDIDRNGTADITIDGQNAADQLLYQNYLRFAAGGGEIREQRAELQGKVGQTVFKALEERPTDLGRLFNALRYNVASRHLMGWSADPDEQLLWERANAAGKLDTEGLQISLVNRSANKLDYHLRPAVVVRTRRAPGDERRVRLEITTSNLPRTPTSPAVEGRVPRQHYNDLVAYLPQNASDVTTEGPQFTRSGDEGGMRVVVKPLYLDLGETQTVVIEFTIPKDQPIRLVPSARAFPIPYTVRDTTGDDKTVSDEGPAPLPL